MSSCHCELFTGRGWGDCELTEVPERLNLVELKRADKIGRVMGSSIS